MVPEKISEEEFKARRRKRAIVLGIVLGLLVIAMYVLTFDKGGALFQRDL